MYWIRRVATSSLSLCFWLFAVEVTFIFIVASPGRLSATCASWKSRKIWNNSCIQCATTTTIDVTIFLRCDWIKCRKHFRAFLLDVVARKKGENFSAEGWIASSSLLPEDGRDEIGSLHNLLGDDEQWRKFMKRKLKMFENLFFICCVV